MTQTQSNMTQITLQPVKMCNVEGKMCNHSAHLCNPPWLPSDLIKPLALTNLIFDQNRIEGNQYGRYDNNRQ